MSIPLHKAALAVIGGGLALNLLAASRGQRTICTSLRDHSRAETRCGIASIVLGSVGALVVWLVHILDPKKRPVR